MAAAILMDLTAIFIDIMDIHRTLEMPFLLFGSRQNIGLVRPNVSTQEYQVGDE